ncbi:MAG: hypothetical protein WA383_16650 [Terriglobales bacterium]
MKRKNILKKQIVRSGLILACGLLTTVAYMTATDQPANSSSGSAVQQPAVAVFRFVPQSEAVTDTAALSGTADVAAVVARLNQRVSEFSEERAAAVARYPTMISTFFGPTFFIWPQFP